MLVCIYVCVCVCVWESWRQKGAQEVLTVEIKEELEGAERREAQSNTRERERERERFSEYSNLSF